MGAILSTLPVLAYHACHGSLADWFRDTLFDAASASELYRYGFSGYRLMLSGAWDQLRAARHISDITNSLFWIFLIAAPAVLGLVVLLRCHLKYAVPSWTYLTVFWNLLALFLQIPAYLNYGTGLTLAALLWFASESSIWLRRSACGVALGLAAVGVYYHAGQSLSRGWEGILAGERTGWTESTCLANCSLHIPPAERITYDTIHKIVTSETNPEEHIFAFPNCAEMYVLTNRPNRFRFLGSTFGIRDENDYQSVVARLSDNPPKVVVFRTHDNYATDFSDRLIQFLRKRYELVRRTGSFEIYRFSPPGAVTSQL